jgi:hypothetical protein
VVNHGIRHVAIDVLPWEVVTFRTICGKDVTPEDHRSSDTMDCRWCRRFERAWRLVKATDVI